MKKILKYIIVHIVTLEARIVLWKYKPKVIGITGSVGKTSAKDAVASVLGAQFRVGKSQKSFNSELGVPLTILNCDNGWSNPRIWLRNIIHGLSLIVFNHPYPEWMVLEIGADRPGDIKRIMRWLRLDCAIVTYIGDLPVHVEAYESVDQVMEEKHAIVRGLKSGGTLIINADDERTRRLRETPNCTVLTFGTDKTYAPDLSGDHYEIQKDEQGIVVGVGFKIQHESRIIPIAVRGVLGEQIMYPILVAFSAGLACDINLVAMHDAIDAIALPKGRMRLLSGINHSVLIDDTYNASPVAVGVALHALRSLSGRKIAVLGDMMELGQHSVTAHQQIGEQCVASHVDMLVTVGVRAQKIAESAHAKGMSEKVIHTFARSPEAGEFLQGIVMAGDNVLVKGSQSVRMEKVVELLMAHPEEKEKLLVRQDAEWQKRKV